MCIFGVSNHFFFPTTTPTTITNTGLRTFTSSNPRLLRAQGFDFVIEQGIEYNHEATTKEAEEEDAQEMALTKRGEMEDAKFGGTCALVRN